MSERVSLRAFQRIWTHPLFQVPAALSILAGISDIIEPIRFLYKILSQIAHLSQVFWGKVSDLLAMIGLQIELAYYASQLTILIFISIPIISNIFFPRTKISDYLLQWLDPDWDIFAALVLGHICITLLVAASLESFLFTWEDWQTLIQVNLFVAFFSVLIMYAGSFLFKKWLGDSPLSYTASACVVCIIILLFFAYLEWSASLPSPIILFINFVMVVPLLITIFQRKRSGLTYLNIVALAVVVLVIGGMIELGERIWVAVMQA